MLNRFPIFRAMASVMIGLALFLTTGGHLAILQGVAWTNMVRDFAKTESIGTALEKTFDGQHPCTLCKKITETGAGKKDDALASAKTKLGEFLPQSHCRLTRPTAEPFQYPRVAFNKPPEILFAPPVPVPLSVG
jgi:hypothetical protein